MLRFRALVQVQIADQNGRSLTLPEDERKSLTVALGLHEKGRAILKRYLHSLKIVLLKIIMRLLVKYEIGMGNKFYYFELPVCLVNVAFESLWG